MAVSRFHLLLIVIFICPPSSTYPYKRLPFDGLVRYRVAIVVFLSDDGVAILSDDVAACLASLPGDGVDIRSDDVVACPVSFFRQWCCYLLWSPF